MTVFNMPKKLLLLPLLMALPQGCTSVTDSGASLVGWGFASDTTAILFYELWEKTTSPNIPVRSSGTSYYGWELKLVDVRFEKVYWKAKVNHGKRNTQILSGRQWADSTMFIALTGEGYWLWTLGSKKPQKISLNWNTEMKNYKTGDLLVGTSYARLRPWKNDSVLVSFSSDSHIIVDSKTMIVNSWSPVAENAWIVACDDFWWGKNEGGCLINNNPYGFTLSSDRGDTLGSFTYAHECITFLPYYNKKCDINSSFYHHFIAASLGKCAVSVCETCPAKNKICAADFALIRYDDKWSIDKIPSFWWLRIGNEFIDSLENITRY
ncbi:MAG: hypothetical protein LBC85_07075 [Fibromonadaceae bacterium]|nr:hypothetical protein [Fibromonadaceae bacterium]